MSDKYVVTANPRHTFEAGEVVTLAPEDNETVLFIRMMAALLGGEEALERTQSKPYMNAEGVVQLLRPEDIKPQKVHLTVVK